MYLQSSLSNRTFKVLIGTQSSDLHVQENGVPQGTILSPTLNLISVESLFRPMLCNIKCFMYADDIVLVLASNNITESRTTLQEEVNTVQKWSRWTGYTILHSKSKILHICNSNYHTLKPITYNNSVIPNTRIADILGEAFDRHLTFKAHTTRVKREARNRINLFRMLGTGQHRASRQTLLQIINSWLLPKLLYGIEIVSWQRENFQTQFAPLYHNDICCATGAFVTSPIASLLCESGRQPLDLIQRANAEFTTLTDQTLPPSKSVVAPGTAAYHK